MDAEESRRKSDWQNVYSAAEGYGAILLKDTLAKHKVENFF
ncbi:unnamed protein product [Haemonchus placei]|uniref:GLOBIN domain-containing protein n=1 Tax=Haemonchus placei TaxID=6290 RepID=A0A0N4X4T9_HAEPC|nr:unnamed protein product [Haemonchus placei]